MIVEYLRPQTLAEALELLRRAEVVTVPLGGGTSLDRTSPDPLAVVDLQALGLNRIERQGKSLLLGATVTLQALMDEPDLPAALHAAAGNEATYNLRQMATVAGTLVAADGRSLFATALLALDAQLTIAGEVESTVSLGELLPLRPAYLRRKLITQIALPLNAQLTCDMVARTPADRPIVCAAVARWPSGRTRVALGGFGSAPLLAMDGPEPGGAEIAARAAYSHAGDSWASAEYRAEMAAVLVKRCLAEPGGDG